MIIIIIIIIIIIFITSVITKTNSKFSLIILRIANWYLLSKKLNHQNQEYFSHIFYFKFKYEYVTCLNSA